MSEVNVRVKSPITPSGYSFTISSENPILASKQYLASMGPLRQPATAFYLVENGERISAKEGESPAVQLNMVLDKQTYTDVAMQVEQLREELGLRTVYSTSVNAGATRLHEIPVFSKKRNGISEDTILEAAEIPTLPETSGETMNASSLVKSEPNPLLPKPAAQDLRFSVWQSLCRDPRVKMQGILAFVYLVSNDGKEWHFAAYPDGFVYVPQMTNSQFVLPGETKATKGKQHNKRVTLQALPTLVQAIEQVSPTTISVARKNLDKIAQNVLATSPVRGVSSVAPWLVGDVPSISPTRAAQLSPPQEDASRDWNEDFQTIREITPESISDRISRDRSMCETATEFASTATDGVCNIIEGAIKPLNPDDELEAEVEELEDADTEKLYLAQGIFYTHGSDFAQRYSGISGGNAGRKAAKKDVAGVEQVMKYQNTRLCPVLSTVVDYCGERLVAQAPVPGIFRETEEPLIVYGQTDEDETVRFNEKVDELMKGLAESLHLKKHPVNKEGLELQTSLEVHGTRSTDGRTYAIDLYRLQVPDLLSESNELNLIRFEAIDRYFSSNPEAEPLNPDTWMDPADLPEAYREQFKRDVDNVIKVATYVREEIIKFYVDQIKSPGGNDPVDGIHLTSAMHSMGINMRLLGHLYKQATEAGLINLASVALSEAIARSLKVLLRQKMNSAAAVGSSEILSKVSMATTKFFADLRAGNKDIEASVENRLKEHFRFGDLPKGWAARFFPSISVTRLLSLKMGLQWDEDFNLVAINPVVRYALPESIVGNEAVEAGITSLNAAIAPILKARAREQEKLLKEAAAQKESDSSASEKQAKITEESNSQTNEEFDSEKSMEQIAESLTILVEAASILTQIYGTSNIEVANVFHRAAMLFYEYGNDIDRAIENERRAIVVAERVAGVDSSEALNFYHYLALYEKLAGHTLTSIEVNKYVIKLTGQLACDEAYKEFSTPFRNVGAILLESRKKDLQKASNEWLQKAVDYASKMHSGPGGRLLLELAQSFFFTEDLEKAVKTAKMSYEIFEKTNGPESQSTAEAKEVYMLLKNASEVKSVQEKSKSKDSKGKASKANNSVPSSLKAGDFGLNDEILQFIMSGKVPPQLGGSSVSKKKSKRNKKKGGSEKST